LKDFYQVEAKKYEMKHHEEQKENKQNIIV